MFRVMVIVFDVCVSDRGRCIYVLMFKVYEFVFVDVIAMFASTGILVVVSYRTFDFVFNFVVFIIERCCFIVLIVVFLCFFLMFLNVYIYLYCVCLLFVVVSYFFSFGSVFVNVVGVV